VIRLRTSTSILLFVLERDRKTYLHYLLTNRSRSSDEFHFLASRVIRNLVRESYDFFASEGDLPFLCLNMAESVFWAARIRPIFQFQLSNFYVDQLAVSRKLCFTFVYISYKETWSGAFVLRDRYKNLPYFLVEPGLRRHRFSSIRSRTRWPPPQTALVSICPLRPSVSQLHGPCALHKNPVRGSIAVRFLYTNARRVSLLVR